MQQTQDLQIYEADIDKIEERNRQLYNNVGYFNRLLSIVDRTTK